VLRAASGLSQARLLEVGEIRLAEERPGGVTERSNVAALKALAGGWRTAPRRVRSACKSACSWDSCESVERAPKDIEGRSEASSSVIRMFNRMFRRFRRNEALYREAISPDLWSELKAEGLLRDDAPVPRESRQPLACAWRAATLTRSAFDRIVNFSGGARAAASPSMPVCSTLSASIAKEGALHTPADRTRPCG
jgi:hypothetical protein